MGEGPYADLLEIYEGLPDLIKLCGAYRVAGTLILSHFVTQRFSETHCYCYYHELYFRDQETEARRGQEASPEPHSNEMLEVVSNLRLQMS